MESVIDKFLKSKQPLPVLWNLLIEETRRQDNAAEERTSTYDNDTDAQAARALEASKRTLQESGG